MSEVNIVCAKVEDWAKEYADPPFMAMICDPPYNLATAKGGERGFMGKEWDNGIAFRPETWAALGQHLLPGAFGMAFASSRGWHRLACAIEDTGFIIHPSIFVWNFGSGFPKATRIPDERFIGHRYGLQCLKPAAEPVIVFQRPYQGKPVDSITRTGAGALWIDGGRIGTDSITAHGGGINTNGRTYGGGLGIPAISPGSNPHSGRWPANFCLVHSPECRRVGSKQVKNMGGIPGENAKQDSRPTFTS